MLATVLVLKGRLLEINTLEGEDAILDMLEGIENLTLKKIEYIGRSDMSFAFLLHAITFAYETLEEKSEVSHLIMDIVSALLQGSDNQNSIKEIIGKDLTKH